jgi:signal transduction histidine kinase
MAGGIAHEIRNPLAITSSAAQILLKKLDDPEARQECAQKIRTAANRAAVIIENLLRFARPSEGLVERVDVNGAVEDTFFLIGHQVSLQSIEIDKRLAPGLPRVKGSKNQLQQVFMNIILNGYHAMPEGGRFTIETRRAPGNHEVAVEVRFADTGCGIPDEHLSRIFAPFFTTMSVGKGTGLGLSIAYSIVQQHGGTIHVESEVGKGSTFTITLPAERPDA